MKRKTSAEFDQELLNLYDDYAHGRVDRRGFFDRASRFAVGGITVAALLEAHAELRFRATGAEG